MDDVCSIFGGVWLDFSCRVSGRHSDNFKDMASKFFIVRIADSALVLANSHPEKPMLIAESILQSVGLSPLLFEVSLVCLIAMVCTLKISYTLGSCFFPKNRRDANDISPNSGQSGELALEIRYTILYVSVLTIDLPLCILLFLGYAIIPCI